MTSIDKTFVKKSFNASAATYDRYAGLQQRMLPALMEFAEVQGPGAVRVLDVGMGTANLTAQLAERFPAARIYGCDIAEKMILYARQKCLPSKADFFFTAADAEFLPFAPARFDVVISSFTYQWLEEWDLAFEEVRRVLRPGGIFIFSVFGKETFQELRKSYNKACRETGYYQGEALELSLSTEKTARALLSKGFAETATRSITLLESYASIGHLIRAIKGMGARNASDRRNKTPGVRKIWQRMVAHYERDYGEGGSIPATFEIIMGRGVKA